MVRSKRKHARLSNQKISSPQRKLPTTDRWVSEIFCFLSEGTLMMASGIVVGIVLGQVVGTSESRDAIFAMGVSLLFFSGFARLVVLCIEVWYDRSQ